jgi:large subunit ribosomal protein L30e
VPKAVSLDNEVRLLIKTGKVVLGAKKSIEAIKLGKAKGVILVTKLPKHIENDVLYYSKIGGVKVIRFNGSSYDLGVTIGKPFPVSTIAILDPGESSLLGEGEA